MSLAELEKRLKHLESEFENLKSRMEPGRGPSAWWKRVLGTFADDADHEAAVKLGQEYRGIVATETDEAQTCSCSTLITSRFGTSGFERRRAFVRAVG